MHTAGEWKYEKIGNSFYVTALGFYDVAVVRNSGNEDNESNARLISSSPKLLEALELIVSTHQFDINDDLMAKAKSAIAAAKGQ